MSDLISKKAAIDAVDSETVSTNPEHFKSSEKFIKFINNADISSFGKWQWANGFNTALVATTIRLKKLPSVQPEHTNIKQTLDEVYAHAETEAEARFHAQQRWIPCSERLPEKDGDYLTTLTDKDGNYLDVTEWQNIIGGRWIAPLDECDYCEIGNVVAWMPLPEPYRAERRTDEGD